MYVITNLNSFVHSFILYTTAVSSICLFVKFKSNATI